MRKLFIKNRKRQSISVLVEQADTQKGLAFVMHGLGGFKEQDHIATVAEAFKERAACFRKRFAYVPRERTIGSIETNSP